MFIIFDINVASATPLVSRLRYPVKKKASMMFDNVDMIEIISGTVASPNPLKKFDNKFDKTKKTNDNSNISK
jgi:hypothetical protein